MLLNIIDDVIASIDAVVQECIATQSKEEYFAVVN